MRGCKFFVIALFLVLVLLATTGCNSGSSGTQQQQVQVVKGDLVIKVNGSGKVGVEADAKPSFGPGGKIVNLYIKEGDTVTKGMVLAKLETDSLELALSQAQVAQAQADVSLTQVQSAQTQAEVALTSAQFNLDRTTAVNDIQDKINTNSIKKEQAQILYQNATLYNDGVERDYWQQRISNLDNETLRLQNDFTTLISKDPFIGEYLYLAGQKYDRLAVEDARIKQLQVTAAQQAVKEAAKNIEQVKRSLDQANKAVSLAQKQLNDATITSNLNGLAVTVDVKEGDTVSGLNVPIYLVDPTTLRVSAQIDEIDVASVKIGQKVNIKLDSAPDTQYVGKVISISLAPVANPQNSGVVVYEVKVGFVNPPPAEVKLGMSATVDIISTEKQGVLLVPSRAVTTDNQGKTVINVLVNKTTETRQVQAGISDGINTEIISGLNAGDTVIVTRAASATGMFGQ
jgi:RND family efflux transporter MFP subunit